MKLTRFLAMVFVILVCPTVYPADQQPVQAALQPSEARQAAPFFQLRDVSGKTVALSEFTGKAVVLNLWATECAGCRAELPTFVELHDAYKNRALTVIGVSMDVMYEDLKTTAEAWARVTPFARAHGLAYTILVDDGAVEKAYKVTAMPATYLIDKRGRIAATYIGIVDSADIKGKVKTLIADRD
jgi:peroxiredoxin